MSTRTADTARPVVACDVGLDMFGQSNSWRDERYIEWGLKRRTNAEARAAWTSEVDPLLSSMGLVIPDKLKGRSYL